MDLPWLDAPNRPLVLAFGGNALLPDPGEQDAGQLQGRLDAFAVALLLLLPDHAGLVLVHGNGPQVGTLLLRSETGSDELPAEPLDVLVAQTQGSIGYLLSRAIRNALTRRGRHVEVATVATQVVVSADDPAFATPTKPVGPFYEQAEGRRIAAERGWEVVAVPGRGLRRVVPSPRPKDVVELHTIADAARHGHLVIAGGGGGIPVVRSDDGDLAGIEAVIDKDRVAALLARLVRAAGFVILTEVEQVSTGFGTPHEEGLPALTVPRARELLAHGEFPEGSMGPKVEAAADYAEFSGRAGLITSVSALPLALRGRSGTWIQPA